MTKRVLDHDPLTGITTYHRYDHATQTTFIEREQDINYILDSNKELYNDESYKKDGIKKSWMHAATIPAIVIEKWLIEDGIDVFNPDHINKVKAKLNSNEYRYLRTASGRI